MKDCEGRMEAEGGLDVGSMNCLGEEGKMTTAAATKATWVWKNRTRSGRTMAGWLEGGRTDGRRVTERA